MQNLIVISTVRQKATGALHDWLRVEFGIEKLGLKLAEPHQLTVGEFIEEVKKRRPGRSKVSAAELQELRREYSDLVLPMQVAEQQAAELEAEVSELVNEAFGLTAEEVDLLWRTAPPRMPIRDPRAPAIRTQAASPVATVASSIR